VQHISEKELGMELTCQGGMTLSPGVLVYAIDGPFFFGTVKSFEQKLVQTRTDLRILIIRLRRVPFMDIAGLQSLEKAILNLEARGIRTILCEANKRVREKIDKAGILAAIETEDYFDDFAAAVARCDVLVDSNFIMAHKRQVVLSEYAESFLKTSGSYLRGALNSSGEG
jgi:SulP family sulfate permease